MRRVRTAAVVTGGSLVLLLVPTAIVLVASLSTGKSITFPPDDLTLHWYREMLGDHDVWSALRNSLYVGLLSVLVNLVCGVPAALALPRVGRHSRLVFTVLLSLGLSSPTIVSAFAFFDVYGQLGLAGNLTGVGVAVAVTCFPFMLWTVMAALDDLDPELMPAAATAMKSADAAPSAGEIAVRRPA